MSDKSQSNHSQRSKKNETFKIVNVDWYDSEIKRDIESKLFDVNYIKIEEYAKTYEQFQKEIQLYTDIDNTQEDYLNKHNNSNNDFINESIRQILESDKDCLIRYNEIESMLKLIQNRYRDFKRSQYLSEFFQSASFTLYILTQHMYLPYAYFSKVISKYEEITYENTIKLIIRCKILYEAREIISEIIKMIYEREYSLCKHF